MSIYTIKQCSPLRTEDRLTLKRVGFWVEMTETTTLLKSAKN